jgi:cobalt-zinc-cadmium efflux system membrane fusion protein
MSCRRARRRPSLVALTAFTVGFSLAGCGGASNAVSSAPASETSAAADASTRVEGVVLSEAALANAGIVVEAAQPRTRSDRILAPALLALDEMRTARVGSLQEGLILETLAQVGDRVRARAVLAMMHGHALHDAWAGYRKALADRRRLEKELTFAIDAHERAQRLYADKAISLQEVQRAEVERVSAKEMVDMAKAEVDRSIEELEHVGIEMDAASDTNPPARTDSAEAQFPVRSPIGGVVLERLVTPGTTVTPGTPLFVVSELSTLWAVAEIDESHLSRVRVGRPVEVQVAAYPDERFPGTITFIADVVNPKTRRITVRSTVPNVGGRLKPEMFATVALGESEPRPMIVVPQSAVQAIDGRPVVFIAEAGGRFRPQPVTLGADQDGLIEVRSGLAEGQPLVTSGSFVLKSELLKPASGGN